MASSTIYSGIRDIAAEIASDHLHRFEVVARPSKDTFRIHCKVCDETYEFTLESAEALTDDLGVTK